ncbi:MAG: HIT domain-containing protein [Chloroflexota bacterium]
MTILFRLGSSAIAKKFVGWVFAHLSFLLPVKRLAESDQLIAFHHPSPSYPVHVLLVPKKAIPNLAELDAVDAGLLIEILQTAQNLAHELGLSESGYRLVINGGEYQKVPQMHFHLIPASDDQPET